MSKFSTFMGYITLAFAEKIPAKVAIAMNE